MKGTINGPLTAFPPDAGPIPSVIDDPVRFDNGSRYQNSNQSDCHASAIATHQAGNVSVPAIFALIVTSDSVFLNRWIHLNIARLRSLYCKIFVDLKGIFSFPSHQNISDHLNPFFCNHRNIIWFRRISQRKFMITTGTGDKLDSTIIHNQLGSGVNWKSRVINKGIPSFH